MSHSRVLATVLATLVVLACAGYYGIVAFAPHLLAGRIAGYPVAVVLALGLFLVFFGATLLYTLCVKDKPESQA